jgi:hypothetical protein
MQGDDRLMQEEGGCMQEEDESTQKEGGCMHIENGYMQEDGVIACRKKAVRAGRKRCIQE